MLRVEEHGEEVSKRALDDGFDWMRGILSKGCWFYELMVDRVNMLIERWVVEDDVGAPEPEVEADSVSKILYFNN